MKTAIVTDSNSGITQKQGEELGIFVLPMPFMIDGQTYFEDIDLTHEEFYSRLEKGADISTSQPSPADVTELWDRILKEYDEIVHIPMSSGLSSSCQTARLLAEDYEDKVYVVDNHRISVTQRQAAVDARDLAAKGWSGNQIKTILEEAARDSMIYITVDTLKYLKKGGRITTAAAALGTILRIKPILAIDGGKLDAFSKARTMNQARSTMLKALERDLAERMEDAGAEKTYLEIAHTSNEEMAREFEEQIREIYPWAEIYTDRLSLSIACHIGPGSLACACTKKLKELE
ncbi:MAG TPA: DegV family protein [Candidatus Enterocloster excrementigallinarum]|uniref:DegV family protein n=1 Tax=Candidatus Enterocloster excrementigallinarum TaxID=2838558 RepID=A0A9D2TEI2_9FIRM|nr:DegV family protein [Candidatus Enterocloster excrementigallinarum]